MAFRVRVTKDWLQRMITIVDAETNFPGKEWQELVSGMRPGDELWEYRSPPDSWDALAGCAGYALVRDGEVIDDIVTVMN